MKILNGHWSEKRGSRRLESGVGNKTHYSLI